MTLEEITRECLEDGMRWFPDLATNLPFLALCAAGEVGEMCNLIKKAERGDATFTELRDRITEEATDAFIYLMNIFAVLEVDPEKEYRDKRAINEQRFGRTATTEAV